MVQVQINSLQFSGSVRATASLTIDGKLGIRDVKIMRNSKDGRLFLSFPSRKNQEGGYTDLCFPVTADFRREMIDAVFHAYSQACQQLSQQAAQPAPAGPAYPSGEQYPNPAEYQPLDEPPPPQYGGMTY